MKIVINKDHLDKNEVLQKFYKVRAIIENNEGEILISFEGGKYIFLEENVKRESLLYMLFCVK